MTIRKISIATIIVVLVAIVIGIGIDIARADDSSVALSNVHRLNLVEKDLGTLKGNLPLQTLLEKDRLAELTLSRGLLLTLTLTDKAQLDVLNKGGLVLEVS